MSESTRTSFGSAQRFLLFGVLIGLVIGVCCGGLITRYYLTDVTRLVYSGGAYPNELTTAYQTEYLEVIGDSYVTNRNPALAAERLKAFDPVSQIRGLAARSADYAADGRAVEAQMMGQLAQQLKQQGTAGWSDDNIKTALADLATTYQGDALRGDTINQFSAQLIGALPVPSEAVDEAPATDGSADSGDGSTTDSGVVAPTGDGGATTAPATEAGWFDGVPWWVLPCLAVLFIGIIVFLVLRYFAKQREAAMNRKKEIVYEGEGSPPIMQWESAYTLGRTPYDESITLETKDGDFLGEAGIGINDEVPGSGSKEVMDFDLWVFDKTDINTYSRILMTEKAYNDEALRAKIEANPLAEPILAKPGEKINIESKTMHIEAVLEEVAVDETGTHFENLKVKMNIFLQEGVDIQVGQMDIPDHVQA